MVQLESFPPYFRRGEQSAREGGRGNTGRCAQFPGEMVVVRGQEGMSLICSSTLLISESRDSESDFLTESKAWYALKRGAVRC